MMETLPPMATDSEPAKRQRLLIVEENGSGQSKIAGIADFGGDGFEIEVFTIQGPLPDIIDDGAVYLPERIDADLVLDFIRHPDLSQDLGTMCTRLGIPVIASGKKSRNGTVITPPTCCGLPSDLDLGRYGKRFGEPIFRVALEDGRIRDIEVLRGSPCGSTWEAVKECIGLTPDEAIVRIGLETQYFCTNDPAGWDPIYGNSPVHYAGKRHSEALRRAIAEAMKDRA